MAAASSPSPSTGTAASPSFEPDDANLLTLLLSSTPYDADNITTEITQRLVEDGLVDRIRSDFYGGHGGYGGKREWMDSLMKTASELGIALPQTVTDNTGASSGASTSGTSSTGASTGGPAGGSTGSGSGSSSSGGGGDSLPKAFQTPAGQKHLAAVQSLLEVDQGRAVALTLAALRTLADRHDTLSSSSTASGPSSAATTGSAVGGASGGGEEKKDDDAANTATDGSARPNLRNLLGTRHLLTTVRSHYHAQRLARLRILAECLRIEQDDSAGDGSGGSIREASIQLLDTLDRDIIHSSPSGPEQKSLGKKRGLFNLLLTVACDAGRVPKREELIIGMDLTSSGAASASNGAASMSGDDSASDFRSYASTEVVAFTDQSAKERTESMEALLVLLYDRIDGGVERLDYAVLSLALGTTAGNMMVDNKQADQSSSSAKRWTKLSALVLAETAALWRATTPTITIGASSDMDVGGGDGGRPYPSWVGDHPLLDGLASSDPTVSRSAVSELNVLGKIVRGCADAIQHRIASAAATATRETNTALEAPEAVGLLTYGLLLRLAGNACSPNGPADVADVAKTLVGTGTDYVTAAMDDYASFDYLYEVLSTLLPSPTAGLVNKAMAIIEDEADEFPELPGDETMLLTDGTDNPTSSSAPDHEAEQEVAEDAAIVAYASIGREVLAGTVAAFRTVLLSQSSSPDNLKMLCNLAAAVYRNSASLCDAFWADWDSYCTDRASAEAHGSVPDADPVCQLLDAAFTMASSALAKAWSPPPITGAAVNEGQRCADALQSIAPLLRLLSSLVPARFSIAGTSTPSASDIFSAFLPDRTVHTVLIGCASLCGDDVGAVPVVGEQVRTGAVEALTSLAHLIRISGRRNEECAPALRSSLEADPSTSSGSATGPRLLHFIASRAATASAGGDWSEDAAKISAAALDIATDLIQVSSDDVEWMALCCLRFSQTRSGAGGFATFASVVREGTSKSLSVLSSAMLLLSAMASQMDRLAFTGTVQNVDVVSEVISTVGNGLLIACDVLTSTPLATAKSSVSLHHDTTHAVLTSLQKALRSIGEIIAAHSSANVRDTAKAVRDGVISFISTSTHTGNAIAYYATLPVSVSLVMELERISQGQSMFLDVGQEQDDEDKENSARKYGAWAKLAQDVGKATGKESIPQTLQSFSQALVRNIHALPMVAVPGHGSSKVQDITKSAIAVLLQWGEHVEAMTLERHGYASSYGNGLAIEDAAAVVAPSTGKAMSSDMQTLSPLRLLLSIAPNPFRPSSSIGGLMTIDTNAPGALISNLNLLSRFLGDSVDVSISEATVKVVTMALRHADAMAALSAAGSSRPGDLSVAKALGGGEQMHQSLLELLRLSADTVPANGRAFMRTAQMVDVLTLSIDAQPTLAYTLLTGGTDNATKNKKDLFVIQSMAKAVKKVAESTSSSSAYGLSLEDLSLASSCLDAFAALWRTSRSRSSSKDEADGNDDTLHPCDGVIGNIIDQTDIIGDCVTILTHHKSLIDVESTNGSTVASLKLNICSSVLEILGNELFAGLRRSDSAEGATNAAAGILDRISQPNAMNEWSLSLTSFSGAAESADCLSDLLQSKSGSIDASRFATLHSSPGKLDIRVSLIIRRAISTMKKVDREDSPSGSIVKPLTKYYYAEKLSHSQLLLIKSWSRFAQVYSSSVVARGDPSDNTAVNLTTPPPNGRSAAGNNTLREAISTADSILFSLEQNSATATTASSASSHVSSTSYLTGKMGCHLSSLLVHVLGDCYDLIGDEQGYELETSLDMIGRLGKVASTLFMITRPIQLFAGNVQQGNSSFIAWSQSRAYRVGCLLRLRVLTCALTLINMVGDGFSSSSSNEATPSSPNHRRFNDACITFSQLASEALAELQYSPSPEEMAGLQVEMSTFASSKVGAHFGYAFQVTCLTEQGSRMIDSASDIEAVSGDGSLALALLKVSISTLLAVFSTSTSLPSDPSSFHLTSYVQRLAASMKDAGTISSIFSHLDTASCVAASTYASRINNPSFKALRPFEDNALDVIQRIIALLEHASSCASGISLPSLLTEQHTIRILAENPLLQIACRQWHAMSLSETDSGKHLRGYLAFAGSAHGTKTLYREDPVHGIWRATLRTLSALLRSFRINDRAPPGRGLEARHKDCLRGVVQFLSTFDALIISCLQSCSFSVQSTSSHHRSGVGGMASSPRTSSPDLISFTSCNLTELGDTLALISELCTGNHKKLFESTSLELYKAVVTASLNVSKSLSSFLGSTGTARELFSVMANLNEAAKEENTSADGSVNEATMALNAAVELHPLLSGGLPSARHEAIRTAHFASSCCIKMTPEEYAMSLESSKAKSDATNNVAATTNTTPASDDSVEQSFQIQVNNLFLVRMERIAAECMFHSLNVISKAHPASDAFVYFTQTEASKLDSMALVQLGMIIALRVPRNEALAIFDDEPDDIEYARVVDADYLRQTWDVEDLSADGNQYSKRRVASSLLAGMEDVANRRCIFTFAPAPKLSTDEINLAWADLSVGNLILALRWCHQQATADTGGALPLVQCLAERSASLLGMEVSLHQELGTVAACGEDVARKIYAQILELFDEDVMQSLDIASSLLGDENNTSGKKGLESVIDDRIWNAVMAQLRVGLAAARSDRDAAVKQWMQSTGGAGQGWAGSSRSNRRSPFRGHLLRSFSSS